MFLLSSCWSYEEIDKMAIISGLAIDKNTENNLFLLTAEIIDFKEATAQSKINSQIIESTGESIFDAVRNMIKISAKKLYWSHAKSIIISQDIATEDIIPLIDWISRDHESRLSMNLFVSKEKTAKELLSQHSVTTEIRTFEMESMLRGNKDLSKAPKVTIYEFMDELSLDGISPVLPAIGTTWNKEEKTAELSGTAVFRKDKFIGFLNEIDSKSFLFIKNKIKGGILNIKLDKEQYKTHNHTNPYVVLEIFKNKTKITPIYKNNRLSMNINITTEVTIEEQNTNINYVNNEDITKLKAIAEQQLEDHIKKVIKMVQQEFQSDIFGFGRIVKAEMPSTWKKIEKNWDLLFKELDVTVHSEIKIKNSALTSTPVKVGDTK